MDDSALPIPPSSMLKLQEMEELRTCAPLTPSVVEAFVDILKKGIGRMKVVEDIDKDDNGAENGIRIVWIQSSSWFVEKEHAEDRHWNFRTKIPNLSHQILLFWEEK